MEFTFGAVKSLKYNRSLCNKLKMFELSNWI